MRFNSINPALFFLYTRLLRTYVYFYSIIISIKENIVVQISMKFFLIYNNNNNNK
jgi:hypothetical protein